MTVPSSGDYSHGPVPTVFVEQAPPPPPREEPKAERRSGGGGAVAVLSVLFIGMLIAGLVGVFFMYNNEHQKVAGAEEAKVRAEKALVAANDSLTKERDSLAKATKLIDEYKTNYGKIEALSKTATAESDKLRELLSRRPGAKVNEKFLQPVTWDAEVLKKFNEHIAGIQREFTRIDTMPAKVIDAAPAQPKIGGG
jgi:hypothetical protein